VSPPTEAVDVIAIANAATAPRRDLPWALARIPLEARDTWESYPNTFTGRPVGNPIDDRGHLAGGDRELRR
jgi:hypothetical protein